MANLHAEAEARGVARSRIVCTDVADKARRAPRELACAAACCRLHTRACTTEEAEPSPLSPPRPAKQNKKLQPQPSPSTPKRRPTSAARRSAASSSTRRAAMGTRPAPTASGQVSSRGQPQPQPVCSAREPPSSACARALPLCAPKKGMQSPKKHNKKGEHSKTHLSKRPAHARACRHADGDGTADAHGLARRRVTLLRRRLPADGAQPAPSAAPLASPARPDGAAAAGWPRAAVRAA